MLRLLDKGLARLELEVSSFREQGTTKARAAEELYPTLKFPPPPEGTSALCARCLTLLSHFVVGFGDGSDFKDLRIVHSSVLRDLSHAFEAGLAEHLVPRQDTKECVICLRVYLLFRHWKENPFYEKAHIEWEKVLKGAAMGDWHLVWTSVFASHDRLQVRLNMVHKGGHEETLGEFTVEPDSGAQNENLKDIPVIGALDGQRSSENNRATLDFSSTLSQGTLSLVDKWAEECSTLHTKCDRIYGSVQLKQPDPWFPDRLVQVRRRAENGTLAARIVSKSDTGHFSPGETRQLRYLSFSHCWGPPPSPLAPLGGRKGSVLTQDTLRKWTTALPLNDLPLAFQQAVEVCAMLNFEYIWIDSLCIMQDSREDWQTQSAVMGDVYKFAFLNIAALSSTSDYDGFIFPRDTRVSFGFHCFLHSILGNNVGEINQHHKPCSLLKGKTRLLWDFDRNMKGGQPTVGPLYTRAWVFQERNLARRTLTFTNSGVYWSCDEKDFCERTGWEGAKPGGVRSTLDLVTRDKGVFTRSEVPEIARKLVETVDYSWHSTVTDYTSCKLTQHSDKLIAVGSIARELSNTEVLRDVPYYAGFWGVNLISQLAWITIEGSTTSPRKQVGEQGYSAPSWSWASIEGRVQPRTFATSVSTALIRTNEVQLADVLMADVELATEFRFGCVNAGWMRLRGVIHRVRSGDMRDKSNSLVDDVTGERFWFCADTVEGFDMVKRGQAKNLVWMPLSVNFDNSIGGKCLVLVEVEGNHAPSGGFVRKGEKVYRRMGTGNFGRIIRMLKPTDLVFCLGSYPGLQADSTSGELVRDFRRREDGMHEFVLI